ncbi:MAG TPA: polysaccharide biosynthesis C-terminal domain-containing protein [Kofleriaceae bacterium]|nr:polysaccharide biosynthesis C-terminal domain-containing protein [Kofleriaceae bacterium]
MAEAEQARLRRDVGWNLVPVVLLAVVGLGLNFAIGAFWTEDALGSFTLVTTAYFTFAVLGALGLQYSVLRAVAEDPTDRARVAAVAVGALIPNVVVAALTTALFVLVRAPIGRLLDSPAVAEGMLWAAPGLFCFAVNKVLMGIVNGLRRMRAFAVYTSLRYALIAIGLALAWAWGLDGDQLPVIWTFTEGVLLLVLLGELVIQVSLSSAAGWLAWSVRHLDYGIRGVLATLAFEINSKLDVWMLGIALPDNLVGIYSLAAALSEGAMQLGVVLQNNLNPVIARDFAAGRHTEIEALTRRTRRWFVPVFIAICAAGAACYPFVIPWLIGKQSFVAGAWPFAIMMLGLALASPYLPFGQMLLMTWRPGWHTVYVVLVTAVNFVGQLLLIPRLGLPGAALALASSFVASALLLRALVRWRVGLRI